MPSPPERSTCFERYSTPIVGIGYFGSTPLMYLFMKSQKHKQMNNRFQENYQKEFGFQISS